MLSEGGGRNRWRRRLAGPRVPHSRWLLSHSGPVKFVAGEWGNENDESVIESVILIFDFFELVQ